MSAAHRLRELLAGAEIELFEAGDRLGGVLNTVKKSGFLIEQSADNFLVKPSAALDLCRELGVADELLTRLIRVWLANRGVWEAIVGAGPVCSVPCADDDVDAYLDAWDSLLGALVA